MFELNELISSTGGKLIRKGKNKNFAVKGISIDSRTLKRGEAFVAIKGDNFDGHDFIAEAVKKGALYIIKEKNREAICPLGVAIIETRDTLRALGDLAQSHRQKFNIPVIAITGSNGKTTAKEMIAWVLSGSFNVLKSTGTQNNQIGLPMTLLQLNKKHDAAVVEIGTNHFGEVEYLAKICRPNIGVITNVGPSHLKYFNTLEGVFKEKISLLRYLKQPAIAVLNSDDQFLSRYSKKKNKTFTLTCGICQSGDFFAEEIKLSGESISFLVNRKNSFNLSSAGRHNVYNALAATATARVLGMSYREISSRISKFVFPKSRLNLLTLNNIRFIDDTYNANPFSVELALSTLRDLKTPGRKIFVMGDMLELGDKEGAFHEVVGRNVAKVCDCLVTVGELSKLAAESAKISGLDARKVFSCASSLEARDLLKEKISPKKDDIILVKGSRLMKMERIFD